MSNILIRKLELFGPLPVDDKKLLDDIVRPYRTVPPRTDVIRVGDAPDRVHLVLTGVACRYKLLSNGKRQIFGYLMPGDFCDLHVFILKAMDHTVATISSCHVVEIPRRRVLELAERPAIARAMWWVTLVDEATLREWLVNLGARDAETRIAHLFCELHLRLEAMGQTKDGEFDLPINQSELADTMGLSPVHISRSLKVLRQQELVVFRGGHIVIPDIKKLREMCGFDPNYLHLGGGKHDKGAS